MASARAAPRLAACRLPAIGATLTLSEIYDGVAFPSKPRILLQ